MQSPMMSEIGAWPKDLKKQVMFPSPCLNFSSNLLDSQYALIFQNPVKPEKPQWQHFSDAKSQADFLNEELEHDLNQSLQQLNLGVDYQNLLADSYIQEYNKTQFKDPFRKNSQRLSIWSTGKTDEDTIFTISQRSLQFSIPTNISNSPNGSPQNTHLDLEDTQRFLQKRNIYCDRLNQPAFIPIRCSCELDVVSENLQSRINFENGNNNQIDRPISPSTHITEAVGTAGRNIKAIRKQCHRHLFETCELKSHAEDFCSTFYKRNNHGYMFIREGSNSPKVNSSGPKSWVTINVKLFDADQKKLKVDVKRLPVWRPINLNQLSATRKPAKKKSKGR